MRLYRRLSTVGRQDETIRLHFQLIEPAVVRWMLERSASIRILVSSSTCPTNRWMTVRFLVQATWSLLWRLDACCRGAVGLQ